MITHNTISAHTGADGTAAGNIWCDADAGDQQMKDVSVLCKMLSLHAGGEKERGLIAIKQIFMVSAHNFKHCYFIQLAQCKLHFPPFIP